MAATARARALRAEGRDVIALTLGEPDFPSPPEAVEAAHQAALRGETKYPAVNGTPALREAVRQKYLRDAGLDYPAADILIGHGARQIIYDALTATLEPGDEIVIPAPYWNAYDLIARMAGAVPVFVACTAADRFRPDPDAIARAVTPRTKWLVLNFPNNPTGAICSPDRLRAIAKVLHAAPHVWVMADDMYEHLILDGSRHCTMAQVAPALRDRVLTISGVSKTYAMTGWRVGFAAGPTRLIAAMSLVQGQSTGGVSPIAQAAARAALEAPQDRIAIMRETYRRRRDLALRHLAATDGIVCHVPEAAFYLFPNIEALLGRSTPGGRIFAGDADFASALLEDALVATVSGAAFGAPGHIRLSTASSDEQLGEACRRINAFCASLVKA